MNLRKHQSDFDWVIDGIICGEVMTVAELERVKVWLGEGYRVPERREPIRVQPVGVGR